MPSVDIYMAEGFEETELVTVADVLRRAGVETRLVSLDGQKSVRGAHDIVLEADLGFADIGAQPDMIVLPGGGPGTRRLRESEPLSQRLRAQIDAGGRVAAICAAPTALAAAGVLQGRRACCFPGCEDALREGGAEIAAYNVVTDGLVTTSRGPGTSAVFALELVTLLVGAPKARELSQAMLLS
ncbi:MAG: DJ-1 family protein [Candidatus Dactylopiibacterium carminicum]|uniref:DJ-1 family protein n=1 Tax=Candidatus Dactylopiibacterium carminicum TaxID=857335 RepID=A0A272EUR2_9RHOO|nr:DJ-1 family glyoxalase III [Candidatus Dactylopiibacterium carminicum]KAF7600321.1 DJ-1 family protein [Candidatus Dactylopiibacterium carminicum]PAS93851.1 MAG: DJ-1 family protein [Candidatus Dactylopiibacterium carminicum]PAT00323.1 MAG: hypothetical protein BSR46_02795 [Candidatus Dactylopiibacterium carminicum]